MGPGMDERESQSPGSELPTRGEAEAEADVEADAETVRASAETGSVPPNAEPRSPVPSAAADPGSRDRVDAFAAVLAPGAAADDTVASESPTARFDGVITPGAPPGQPPSSATVDTGPIIPRSGGASAERYRIEDELGRGGMAVVFQAFDRDLRRPVAMKVILAELEGDDAVATRFVEEAQATAQLQHPGIVPVYEIGVDHRRRLYFTMKLVEGRTLAAVVKELRGARPDPALAAELTLHRLLEIFAGVCRAVAYAHSRGVLHRDLKPQNIMIGQFGEAWVMDWGLARVYASLRRTGERPISSSSNADEGAGRPRLTQLGEIVGTPAYMSPEQARANPDVTIGPASDIFSLGATLFHTLSGRPPFVGPSRQVVAWLLTREAPRLAEVVPDVPAEIDAICAKALARAPADRYGSAAELADDVQRFLEGRSVSAHPDGIAGWLVKVARRHAAVTLTVAIAVSIGLLLLLVGIVRIDRERRRAEVWARDARVASNNAALARARAEASLSTAFAERADRAWDARDALSARLLFAHALSLADGVDARRRLLEATVGGARIAWRDRLGEAVPLAWQPGERLLAVGDRDDGVWLLDGATGERFARLRGEGATTTALAWRGDGARLAIGSADGRVRVVEVPAGASARELVTANEVIAIGAHEGRVARVALGVTNDGRELLVTTGRDGDAFLFDVDATVAATAAAGREGRPARPAVLRSLTVDGARRRWIGATVTGEGRAIVASNGFRDLGVWDLAAGEQLVQHEASVGAPVLEAALDPAGRFVAIASGDGRARLLRVRDQAVGEPLPLPPQSHPKTVQAMALDPTGDVLVSADSGGRLLRWDLATGELLSSIRGHESLQSIGRLAIGHRGQRISAIDADGWAWSFEVGRDEIAAMLENEPKVIRRNAWSADGARLAMIVGVDRVRTWSVGRNQPVGVIGPLGWKVEDVALDPTGERIVIAGEPRVATRDATTGAVLDTLATHPAPTTAVAWSLDGARLATGAADGSVRLTWPSRDGAAPMTLPPLDGSVVSLAWSHDGRRLAAASAKGDLRVLAIVGDGADATAVPIVSIRSELHRPRRVALDATGARVALLGLFGDGVIHASASGRRIAEISQQEGNIRGGRTVSPDFRRIVSTDIANVHIEPIDDPSIAPIVLPTIRSVPVSPCFDPAGTRLAVGGGSGVVVVWDLDALDRSRKTRPGDLLRAAETATGLIAQGFRLEASAWTRGSLEDDDETGD